MRGENRMKTALRKGITYDDIRNLYKGITERRHFYRFCEFGNYVLGFGGSTKKNDLAISCGGAYIIPNWIIAVEKSQVEKMDSEDCPSYLAETVISKFLSTNDSNIAVSIIFDKELLYYDADEETHELILKKARSVLL